MSFLRSSTRGINMNKLRKLKSNSYTPGFQKMFSKYKNKYNLNKRIERYALLLSPQVYRIDKYVREIKG